MFYVQLLRMRDDPSGMNVEVSSGNNSDITLCGYSLVVRAGHYDCSRKPVLCLLQIEAGLRVDRSFFVEMVRS
jgi:hypothetical protein